MLEKRRFHRVRFKSACEMIHNTISYRGQLENISLNGALVSFSDGVIVPQDDECLLKLYLEGERGDLQMTVKVIYANFTMVGVKFSSMDGGSRERLIRLVAALSDDPAKVAQEQKLLESEELM
ncbi:MAG TPA: PilZ domain-containing protein [Geobacteraceae bacterium]